MTHVHAQPSSERGDEPVGEVLPGTIAELFQRLSRPMAPSRISRRSFLKMSAAAVALAALPAPIALYAAQSAQSTVTVDETGPIGKKWVKLGGAPVVGVPLSEIVATPDQAAQYQIFANGVIVYSAVWGAMLLSLAIFQKWLSLNSMTEAGGANLLSYVGFPKEDVQTTAGVQTGHFERGTIAFETASGQSRVIYGGINVHYWNLDGALGLPLNEETPAANGGRYQSFQAGDIYWRADLDAFEVRGQILQRWLDLGGAAGVLGYPLSDEQPVIRDGSEIGRSSRFEHGTIYFSTATGAWDVLDRIRQTYEESYDGPVGWLGFPIGGMTATPTSGGFYNDFENGLLVSHESGAYAGVQAFAGLDLFVQRIEGSQSEGLCGSEDTYAYLRVTSSHGPILNVRRPHDGNYGGGHDLNEAFALTSVVRSDLTLHCDFDGWDEDGGFCGSDDHLGNVTRDYSIDNLWGTHDGGPHTGHDDGSFTITYNIRNPIPFDPSQFRQQMFWSFDNFGVDKLSYDQYAATFRDVNQDEFWLFHPFNRIYYETFYKGIAADGVCFGMSLESVFAQTNRSLYSEPISRFFPDTQDGKKLPNSQDPGRDGLINELCVKHGYQIGAACIDYFLSKFINGEVRDPKNAFLQSRAFHERGDYPVLALSSSLLKFSGHAVRPYHWDDTNPDRWYMYIANPSYPVASYGDDAPYNVIEIDPHANTFRFQHTGSDVWTGGNGEGGRLFAIPQHVLNQTPRTPFWEALALLVTGTLLILGDGATSLQIEDGNGRMLFKPGLAGPPTRWEDLQDDATRIPNLAPVLLTDAGGAQTAELYYGRGAATYHHSVVPSAGVAAGQPIEWTMHSATLSAHVISPATPTITDIFTAEGLHTTTPRVVLQIPANGVAKSLSWTFAGAIKHRWFELTDLALIPGQTIAATLSNGGFNASFENSGPATTAKLRVQYGPGTTPVELGAFTIESGTATQFAFDVPLTTATVAGTLLGNLGWWRSPVQVTLTARDFSNKGIALTQYREPGADWVTYTGPFSYATEGTTALSYRSKDNDGNQEETKQQTIKIDTKPPVITLGVAAGGLSVQADDGSVGSGVATVNYSADGGTTWVPVTNPLVVTPDVLVQATDVAGNTSQQHYQIRGQDNPSWVQYSRNSHPQVRFLGNQDGADIGVRSYTRAIDVHPNQPYTFKLTILESGPAIALRIKVRWFDSQKRELAELRTTEAPGKTGLASYSVVAPANAVYARVNLRGAGVGILWLDDAAWVDASGNNLLPGGDFAAGLAPDWEIEQWEDMPGIVEVLPYGAGNALRISSRPIWLSPQSVLITTSGAAAVYQRQLAPHAAFKVKPGTNYELATALRSVNAPGGAIVVLRFYDPNGHELSNAAGPRLTGTFDWQWVRFSAIAPAQAATARASIYLDGPGSLWCESVVLTGE